ERSLVRFSRDFRASERSLSQQAEGFVACHRHLCRYRYSDPTWDAAQGAVYGKETMMAFGLILIPERRIHLGRVDPEKAREVFIWEALIHGRTRSPLLALEENRRMIAEVKRWEHKLRRRDGLLHWQGAFEFYDEVLPEGCCSQKAFEQWVSKDPTRVRFDREDVMIPLLEPVEDEDYPDEFWIPGSDPAISLPLSYHHYPTDEEDGITVTIPIGALEQVPDWAGDWLVPGWLPDKVTAVLRSLAKPIRQLFPPIGDVAEAFLEEWEGYEPHCFLLDAVIDFLRASYDQHVERDAFDRERVPLFLSMRYEITDEKGKRLASGRDLATIRAAMEPVLRERVAKAMSGAFEERRMTSWTLAAIPERVSILTGAEGYPALEDEGEAVRSRVLPEGDCARETHGWGVARLIDLTRKQEMAALRKELFAPERARQPTPAAKTVGRQNRKSEAQELNSLAAAFGSLSGPTEAAMPSDMVQKKRLASSSASEIAWSREALWELDQLGEAPRENREELLLSLIVVAMGDELPRTKSEFEQVSERVMKDLWSARLQVLEHLVPLLQQVAAVRSRWEMLGVGYEENRLDGEEQWRQLFAPGWMRWATRVGWRAYGAVVEGVLLRVKRMEGAPPAKDLAKMDRFWERAPLVEDCGACGKFHPIPRAVEQWREQNRVRLVEFAPEVKGRFG
ncbi:MAG: DUF3418 domain-containing protein, partial [Verrucomicrobiota bacterium]